MIDIDHLTYTYPHTESPALVDVSLQIPAGAFVLVCGASGSGKSTLLRALNGLVPHFYGGTLAGRVLVGSVDTKQANPRKLATTVGFVFQDPTAQFVVQTVEDEIAFGLENLGIAPSEMPERISQALAAVGAAHLQMRQINTLSGGEAQRIAVACALVMQPKVLVLDEPTSQLDPAGADALLKVLIRLHQKHGITIILAEHRLARLLSIATHLLILERGQTPRLTTPHELPTALHPSFLAAANHLGWQPLPLSLAEARAMANQRACPPYESTIHQTDNHTELSLQTASAPVLQVKNLSVGYGKQTVLHDLNFDLRKSECLALLGANGSGKSTLLKVLAGLLIPEAGTITYAGQDIMQQRVDQRAQNIAYVPQDPNTILFADTLLDELHFTLDGLQLPPVMEPVAFLEMLRLDPYAHHYPRDLSGGERQRAALAAMLIAERPILLLDEPTLGLDYMQRETLVELLRAWQGRSIILATHDLELAGRVADRVIILEHGHIAADGIPREVLFNTPSYQTQLAQVFDRADLLTTDDLR